MTSVVEKVKVHFNRTSNEFDAIYTGEKSLFSQWLDRVFRWDMYERFNLTIKECGYVRGKRILDIGCGSGRYTISLARMGAKEVVGIDFAENMLKIAKDLARKEGCADRCQFVSGDFIQHRFDKAFDISLAIGVFDYIEKPMPFLARMRQLTLEKVIMTFPNKRTLRRPIRKIRLAIKGCPVYFFSRREIEHMLISCAYHNITIRAVGKIFFVTAKI